MIKAVLTNETDGPTVVLGLTRENIQAMQEGMPVLVRTEELGLAKGKIVIAYGMTIQDLLADLRAAGLDIDTVRNPQPGETIYIEGKTRS